MLRYDPLSGQVFTERLVKTRDRLTNPSRPAEERRTPYEMQLEAERLKHLGVESLHAKAMRKLIVNARSLTPDALRATPAPITMQIWKEIIREYVGPLDPSCELTIGRRVKLKPCTPGTV